jgi:hypothetical protein
MATHLSESSVNSLLRLINKADTSGSYTEKVDLLKKSGILVGGHEYAKGAKQIDLIKTHFTLTDALQPNATSENLSNFFVDGTYNFTYILFPTPVLQNGATGTGTSVISSNYDSSTKLLDKKAMINTFLTQPNQPSQISLQSFDIKSSFMVMETYGSSLVGLFNISGNKLQILDYGFDSTTGTFTNFYTVYQKTQIGLVVSNYNLDADQLHSVWYYSIVPATQ